MTRPRFLADHDLNEHIIDGVQRREPAVEFIRVRDVDLEEKSDPEILQYAAENGLLVVSHDVNTMPAHARARLDAGKDMAGLFMARQFHPISPIIESLVLIWSASEAEEWHSQICFLPL